MATLIHAIGRGPNKVYRVYWGQGERHFPEIKSRRDLYALLAKELGLPDSASDKDVVFALMEKSWDKAKHKWVDDFRVNLKRAREVKNLTQAQLAERAELSIDGIRALEQGLRRPGADTLRRLAVVLEVSVDDLLGALSIEEGTETHNVLFS